MNQGRIFPLVGPLLVLYLIFVVGASAGALDAATVGTCALALALAGVPGWVLRRERERVGVRRVTTLGMALGVALVRWARPELPSLYLDLGAAAGVAAASAVTLSLAFDTPDQPAALSRRRGLGLAATLGAIGAWLVASLAVAPALPLFGDVLIVSPRWSHAVTIHFGLALALSVGLRSLRRRLGSTPEALAAGSWAQLGTWAALLCGLVLFTLTGTGTLEASSTAVRGLWAFGSASLLAGHLGMLGARRQVRAGRNTRRLSAAFLSIGVVALGAGLLAGRLPNDPIAVGVAFAFAVAVASLLQGLLGAVAERALAPFFGRLLLGVDEALSGAFGATSFEELGEAILPPLRRATGSLDGEPRLFALDPPRAVWVDAAGVAHVDESELSPALRARLLERPGEIVVAAPLGEQVVRRADLRPLVDALERLDALCVVPLTVDSELDGALVVARGRRRSALTLEEIDRLERLGRRVSAQVAMLSSHERSRQRTRDAVLSRERLEEQLEARDEELAKLRADSHTLKAGGAAERFTEPAIAYSPAMRTLTRRVQEVGPLDAPVLLVGEDGSAIDRIGHLLHAAGGRRDGPFVVASCASVRPERAEAALFGEGAAGQPGWLHLAEGGTCLLLDVPALSFEAQAKLAEAIATRRAQLADGAGTIPIDARVIATSRVPLGPLVAVGAFDPELYRRLEGLMLTVPPLRERLEDLPSLVLLALDRACRTVGRPVVGVEPAALERLSQHDWPGNLSELASVIDRAVARAKGPSVVLEDLPTLSAGVEPSDDPLFGTYAEIESRALVRAMEQAGGNKSEAARLLGLARSTFLDKLKRYELQTPPM